jgi:hypothetical protein
MKRFLNKRCGTILETKLNIDVMLRSNNKLSEDEYLSIKKCPIINFNGPFEPCYGLQKRKKVYRLNRHSIEILEEINRGAISGQEARIYKSRKSDLGNIYSDGNQKVLKRKEKQFYKEINKKIQTKIFTSGMDEQSLVNQFYGEQDRFNVNIRQRNYFKRFKKDLFS